MTLPLHIPPAPTRQARADQPSGSTTARGSAATDPVRGAESRNKAESAGIMARLVPTTALPPADAQATELRRQLDDIATRAAALRAESGGRQDVGPMALRQRWIDQGLLTPTSTLAQAWQMTPQAINQRHARHQLVGLIHKGRRYFPADFQRLTAEQAEDICETLQVGLGDNDDVALTMFLSAQQAADDHLTVLQLWIQDRARAMQHIRTMQQEAAAASPLSR
ncbi:MAG: hypothetical protein RLY78_368 [Pseudomonadota bacterium]|jgi:hypothetical protein